MIPALSLGVPSEMKAASINLLSLIILLAGCLLLGRQQAGEPLRMLAGRKAGRPDLESVAAAFLCAGYCYVLWAGRRALIDFSLMAWVTLTLALLARTEGFSSRRQSLVWGAAAGVGLLMKPPFAFFLLGPVVWALVGRAAPGKKQNFLRAMALCAGLCVPWYFWQGAYFFDRASHLAHEITGQGTDPRTLAGWLYYIQLLPMQLGPASLVFTGLGAAFCLWARPWKENAPLVFWIGSGYLVLTLLINKDPRHTLPLLPALALLAARGWGSVIAAPWGAYLVSAAAALLFVFNHATYDRPEVENWKHGAILNLLAGQHDTSQPFLTASVLSHHPRFFARTLKWSAIQRGIEFETVSPGDADASFAEFVITRPGDQGSETAHLNTQWQSLQPGSRVFKDLFTERARHRLPDGSEAIVYRREPHPRFQVRPLNRAEVERRVALAAGRRITGPVKVSAEAAPAELAEGRLRRLRIACGPCEVDGVRVQRMDVIVEKPWINLYRLWDEDRLGLLAFESIQPVLEIKAEDAAARLSKVKGLSRIDVQFSGRRARVRARYREIPAGAVVRLTLDPSAPYPSLRATLRTITLGGVPLPGWLLGKTHRQVLPLYPIPSFPGRIQVNSVQLNDGVLKIN